MNPPTNKWTKDELKAELCKKSFWFFIQSFWEEVPGAGVMEYNWHMKLIADELQDLAKRVVAGLPRTHDLIINISPGTSKSTLCSILFQPWTWTFFPQSRHLTASHTDTLVLDLANKSRQVIESEKYKKWFSHIQLHHDQNTKSYFRNTLGGDRLTCTVAGKSPTGFHGHFLGIDDPLDPKKAVSELELKNARDFAVNVLPTRKVNKEVSVTFLIMQRLHRNDPTGVMLEVAKMEGTTPIRHICLPAELQDNVHPPELREKYVDGLMDPNRLSARVLKDFKARLGVYAFSGQFSQNPTPLGGGMFKEQYFNQRIPVAPYHASRVLAIDRACLIKNTEIETDRGPKPIQDVKVGDFVLTRQGYKRVKWSGQTKTVKDLVSVYFDNGSMVTGTPDHKIWTNQGWVDLASISSSHYAKACEKQNEKEKQSSLMENNTTATKGKDTSIPEATSFIEPFGVSIMDVFPMAAISITKTSTGTTIIPRILSALPDKSTIESTMRLPNGTEQKLQESITKESSKLFGKTPSTKDMSVNNVESLSDQEELTNPRSFAARSVESDFITKANQSNAWYATKSSGEGQEPIAVLQSVPLDFGNQHARFVIRNLKRLNELKSVAQEAVVQNGNGGIPVYDLEVEDAHEFFANGILVHNSTDDGGCYTAMVLLAHDGDNYFIEHCVHGQWEPDERNERILAEALRCRTRYGPNNDPVILIEAEGGSSGKDAWKAVARKLAGFVVREEKVTGAKDARAEPWSCQLAAGNVKIVEDGTWDVNGYIQEHVMFKPDPTVKRMGKYKDQVDASCLISGTQIRTIVGLVPIEKVKAGDFVLTRQGYKEVEWAGKTGEVRETVCVLFSNGSLVESTREHLVWTLGRGWIRMDSLTKLDCVLSLGEQTCQENHKDIAACAEHGSRKITPLSAALESVLHSGIGIKEEENISTNPLYFKESFTKEDSRPGDTTKEEVVNFCTETSGENITATSPLAMIFITRTETTLTTKSVILNALAVNNTLKGIRVEEDFQDKQNTLRELVLLQLIGTNRRRVESGIENMPESKGLAAVYDLTVKGAHEFFANGVLVHNSMGFNWLVSKRSPGTLRFLRPAGDKKAKPRFIICSKEELAELVIEDLRSLLIVVSDPKEQNPDPLPPHGVVKLLEAVNLRFVDLSPEEYQDKWDKPLAEWGDKLPKDLQMTREDGKKLWSMVTRKRDNPFEVVLFADEGDKDRRAKSLAYAVADQMRLPRESTIYQPSDPDNTHKGDPPCKWLYEHTKSCRSLVI